MVVVVLVSVLGLAVFGGGGAVLAVMLVLVLPTSLLS